MAGVSPARESPLPTQPESWVCVGSSVLEDDHEALEQAFTSVLHIAERIEATCGKLDHVDLGGGVGIRYRDETPIAIDQYARMIRRVLANRRDLALKLEPGRRIVGTAGLLLTRVLYTKTQGTRNFAKIGRAHV